MDNISRAFEWIAVGVLVLAFLAALAGVAYELRRGTSLLDTYHQWRAIFGRGLLVGLEILVAADLIRTVAVEPTLENIGVLGLIVVVRTVLSFSLDIEIDGVLPWRKAELQARERAADHTGSTG
jgi:uncharacterized membrane protein